MNEWRIKCMEFIYITQYPGFLGLNVKKKPIVKELDSIFMTTIFKSLRHFKFCLFNFNKNSPFPDLF